MQAFISNHAIYKLCQYWLVDAPGLLPTYFEVCAFFVHFNFLSLVGATIQLTQSYC